MSEEGGASLVVNVETTNTSEESTSAPSTTTTQSPSSPSLGSNTSAFSAVAQPLNLSRSGTSSPPKLPPDLLSSERLDDECFGTPSHINSAQPQQPTTATNYEFTVSKLPMEALLDEIKRLEQRALCVTQAEEAELKRTAELSILPQEGAPPTNLTATPPTGAIPTTVSQHPS